jgi:hypothetical protein
MPQYLVAIQHPNNFDPSLEGEAMIRDIGALNKTRLGSPNAQIGAPSAGTITTLLAPRQIQFGLKYVF